MIQVASCEQALVQANRKPIQSHQIKAMPLFKTYTLEFEFDKHFEHVVSYQEMQNRLPVFLAGEFSTFGLLKPNFSYLSNYKHQKYITFGQNMIISFFLLITNQLYLSSGLFIKLKT